MGGCQSAHSAPQPAVPAEIPRPGPLFALNIPLLMSNNIGTIQHANTAAYRLLGFEEGTLVGHNVEILVPERIRRHHASYMKRYLDTGQARIIGTPGREVEVMCSNGRKIPVLLTICRTATGFAASLVDLRSATKAREQTALAKTAHQMVEERTRFISFLSHEIRVPMNALCMGISVLSNRAEEGSDEVDQALKVQCSDMRDCCEIILHLLNDVLDLEKMRSGNYIYTYTSTDLKVLTSRAEHMARLGYSRARTVTFSRVIAPQCNNYEVWCDGHRLLQVVSNFLSNGVRHANMNGQVQLSVTWDWRQETPGDATLRQRMNVPEQAKAVSIGLRVWNSGSFIAPEVRSSIFKPFVQLMANADPCKKDDRRHVPKSAGKTTGIGLAVCHEIVSVGHGGKIEVDSDASGTMFTARLPIFAITKDDPAASSRARRASPSRQELALSDPGTQKKGSAHVVDVLCVEDSLLNRKMLGRMLDVDKITYRMCGNGREAVDWIEAGGLCKLILMDKTMPVMNGVEATKRIKQLAPEIPIVGLTGDAQHDDVKTFKEAGAVHILTKPVFREQLMVVAKAFLQADGTAEDLLSITATTASPTGSASDEDTTPQ